MPTRRNPIGGDATFDTLTVRNLRAGFTPGDTAPVPDDNAEHQLHGRTTLSGAPDTLVLDVQQHARVQELLSAGRLDVGMTLGPDASPYDDPYPSAESDLPYPDRRGEGYSEPQQTGLTVNESGDLRTTGHVVAKNAATGLVLRAPTGDYYSFVVDAEGRLSPTGRRLDSSP